jgi:membrane-bound metal-dependent hydrolase YbcI (DUF457 family)
MACRGRIHRLKFRGNPSDNKTGIEHALPASRSTKLSSDPPRLVPAGRIAQGLTTMPLPLGHVAIGLAANELASETRAPLGRLKVIVLIFILSNLPDVDIVIGLLWHWNGCAFHRGPTHSLLFAILAALFYVRLSRRSSFFPTMSVRACFLIVLSHVLADYFLTNSAVSLFWPLETHFVSGQAGWIKIFHAVAFEEMQDAGIVLWAAGVIAGVRWWKVSRRGSLRTVSHHLLPVPQLSKSPGEARPPLPR